MALYKVEHKYFYNRKDSSFRHDATKCTNLCKEDGVNLVVSFFKLNALEGALRESTHVKVDENTCDQILVHQVSVFPVDVDQSAKYGYALVTAHCFCMAIFTRALYML